MLISVLSVNRRKWDNCHLLISGSAAAGAVVDASTSVLSLHRSPRSGESSFSVRFREKGGGRGGEVRRVTEPERGTEREANRK